MVKFARCPKIYVCHLLHRLVPQPIVSLLHKILNNITVKETMVPSVAIVIEVMVTLLILEVGVVVVVVVVDMEEIDMKEVAVVIDSVEVEIASEEVEVAVADLMIVAVIVLKGVEVEIASEEVEVAAADLMIVQEDRMVTLAGGAVVAVVEVDMIIVMHRLEEEELEEEVADSRLVVEVPENALV
jgi:hypothetical protein